MTLRNHLPDSRVLFQQELVFQILQFPYLLKDTVLIVYQVQVMNNLPVNFEQIMIRIVQLQLDVAHHIPHLHIHGYAEKDRLLVINQLLTFSYQQRDVLKFFT